MDENYKSPKKLKSPKDIGDRLDKLNDKLYDKIDNYKVKSKLVKKRKNIPGMGYYFKK